MGNSIVSEEVCFHILQFTDWGDRHRAGSISKRCWKITSSPSFYHWCCQRLAAEHFVYCPVDYVPKSWKSHLQELYRLKNMWQIYPNPSHLRSGEEADQLMVARRDDEASTKLYKINVYARFRPNPAAPVLAKKPEKKDVKAIEPSPKKEKAGASEVDKENDPNHNKCVEVNLPLHQRLAMIKLSHNLTSNKAALKVLAAEGGWFHKKWDSLNATNTDERIVVQHEDPKNIPRFRENSEKEVIMASVQSVDVDAGRVVMIAPDVGLRLVVRLYSSSCCLLVKKPLL
jgi:hypothetical protein